MFTCLEVLLPILSGPGIPAFAVFNKRLRRFSLSLATPSLSIVSPCSSHLFVWVLPSSTVEYFVASSILTASTCVWVLLKDVLPPLIPLLYILAGNWEFWWTGEVPVLLSENLFLWNPLSGDTTTLRTVAGRNILCTSAMWLLSAGKAFGGLSLIVAVGLII